MSAGVGVCAGRSNRSFIDCISIRSNSILSALFRIHDSQFVRRAERVVVSCNSIMTYVPISLKISIDATVLIEIVVAMVLSFQD